MVVYSTIPRQQKKNAEQRLGRMQLLQVTAHQFVQMGVMDVQVFLKKKKYVPLLLQQ